MVFTIEDKDFKATQKALKPDSKKRVVLPKHLAREGVTYRLYYNEVGQILLDPQVTIPASEAWLFKNPEAIASVRRGLSDAQQGKVSKVDLNTL